MSHNERKVRTAADVLGVTLYVSPDGMDIEAKTPRGFMFRATDAHVFVQSDADASRSRLWARVLSDLDQGLVKCMDCVRCGV